MGLITGLCFSTVFLAWEGEAGVEDWGSTSSSPSSNELGQIQGGGQVEQEHDGAGGERTGANMTLAEVLLGSFAPLLVRVTRSARS